MFCGWCHAFLCELNDPCGQLWGRVHLCLRSILLKHELCVRRRSRGRVQLHPFRRDLTLDGYPIHGNGPALNETLWWMCDVNCLFFCRDVWLIASRQALFTIHSISAPGSSHSQIPQVTTGLSQSAPRRSLLEWLSCSNYVDLSLENLFWNFSGARGTQIGNINTRLSKTVSRWDCELSINVPILQIAFCFLMSLLPRLYYMSSCVCTSAHQRLV